MNLLLIGCAAFLSTYLGGSFALKFKDRLHLILGFSAGAVIAVAFFDLLPESIVIGSGYYGVETITTFVALGFLVFMLLDRFVLFHRHIHDDHDHSHDRSHARGIIGAGSLSLHSFLDGVAIGLAFQVSSAIGVFVTVAVLAHDFSDGINTVNMVLKNGGTLSQARKWLLVDSLTPVIGIFSTFFFTLPEHILALILALFAGFFTYIGATDLLPESHHSHPTLWTSFSTILGMVVLYLAIHFAGM